MRVILFNREFIIAFLMRSSEQSLAMRSSILFLSGSIYKSPAEFNVVVQRSDAFPRRLLPRESSSPRDSPTCRIHPPMDDGTKFARANLLLDYK